MNQLEKLRETFTKLEVAMTKRSSDEEIAAIVQEGIIFDELKADSIRNLAEFQYELGETIDVYDRVVKELNKVYDTLRIGVLPEKMAEEDITSMKIDGIGRLTVTADLSASIDKDKLEDAYTWLRDTGNGDIIKETVNASSLKSVIKAGIKSAIEIPDCFKVNTFNRTSITRTK
jgi:hypothetical protein